MNLADYMARRTQLALQVEPGRSLCLRCLQPSHHCYCTEIRRFDPKIKFVILQHKLEARRRIATGRMSHLSLENSELFTGQDFSDNAKIDSILATPTYQPIVLYPGASSLNLSEMPHADRAQIFQAGRVPVIFVIDGTWNTARKMIRSRNLLLLPRICFTPVRPSNFRVRKQPAPGCMSTLEAIHATIELLGDGVGFAVKRRAHDGLLHVFDHLVEQQLEYVRRSHRVNTRSRHHPVEEAPL